MKKLVLAIGFAAFIVFGASSGSLAAYRVDNGAGVATNRDSRIWSETGTNPRLVLVNEALYPDTVVTAGVPIAAHGNQERADAARASSATSIGAHGNQERADMAQAPAFSTDTQRMFCEGDICLVP